MLRFWDIKIFYILNHLTILHVYLVNPKSFGHETWATNIAWAIFLWNIWHELEDLVLNSGHFFIYHLTKINVISF